LNLILNKYSAADLARAFPEYGNVQAYQTAKDGLPEGLIVPGSLDAQGRLQAVQGTPEFFRAEQIATNAAREAVRRAAIANGLGGPDGKDVIATTGVGPDGKIFLTTNRGDIDITSYFQGLPSQPVPISVAVATGATTTVDTGFRKVEILSPTPTNQVVNTKEGTVTFGPDSELAKFIQWQGSQPNPVGPGTIADQWARQGISDPYSNPSIVGTAVEVTNRAGGREEPWNDPNWPAYQGSTKDSFNSAVQARTKPAEFNKLLAETGWDVATANSWIERILEPEKWAAARAEDDRRNGVVVGGGFVTGPTPGRPTSAAQTVYTGGNPTLTSIVSKTPTAVASALASNALTAIDKFIQANPSNFVRRRSGQTALTPAQAATRDAQLSKLTATATAAAATAEATATTQVQGVVSSVNQSEVAQGVIVTPQVANQSATQTAVASELTDPTLSRQTELSIAATTPGSSLLTTAGAVAATVGLVAGASAILSSIPTTPVAREADPTVDPAAPAATEVIVTPISGSESENTAGYPVSANVFSSKFDEETGDYYVVNNSTGEITARGLTQSEADQEAVDSTAAAEAAAAGPLNDGNTTADITAGTPTTGSRYVVAPTGEDGTFGVFDNQTGGFISTGLTESDAATGAAELNALENPPEFENTTEQELNAEQEVNTIANAQKQAVLQAQKKFADNGDWRVKLSLAPGANYLYNDTSGDGILQPLQLTDGIVFPYTPSIDTSYRADYDNASLTHSNYKSYFYKSSSVEAVNLQATFTAQDTVEANYLLAVIHFLKSATKMFYGQDAQRGSPPPLVYLTGYGTYQFNGHPCLVTSFQYSLPKDVDYIRARSANVNGASLLSRRNRQSVSTNPVSSAIVRLENLFTSQGITKGADFGWKPAPPTLGLNSPTYVPTKMDITISLLPVQSRSQVSQEFSLQGYANGALLRGGFW
jgi:hypothetical protein